MLNQYKFVACLFLPPTATEAYFNRLKPYIRVPYFVYLLACRDGSYYCGYTANLVQRVAAHNAGRGGRYTRSHRPVKLVYSTRCRTQLQAMRREREIKAFSRKQKQALIVSSR